MPDLTAILIAALGLAVQLGELRLALHRASKANKLQDKRLVRLEEHTGLKPITTDR